MQRIRRNFNATALIAVVVLVLTGGGAWAASRYVITSTKQISPKVLKALKGADGKKGTAGLQGAQGPTGPGGAQGAKGENGGSGTLGATGATGSQGPQGATGGTGSKGVTGTTGVAGTTGVTGPTGESGFTETLPAGKTETGVIATVINNITENRPPHGLPIPVSFPIPVEASAPEAFFVANSEIGSGIGNAEKCTGNVAGPTAPPGVLCVYARQVKVKEYQVEESPGVFVQEPTAEATPSFEVESGAAYGLSGTTMQFRVLGSKAAREEKPAGIEVFATWAVTAPTTP